MKLSAVTLFTVVLCLVASVAFKDKGDEIFDKIDKYLNQMEAQGNSGHVLVSVKGEVYERGFGKADREEGRPFTPETITGIGSITKQFTAAAILKLEEEGKLKTTDLVSSYFANVPPDKQSMTLHHLLTHTAGFPGAIGDDYANISTEEFIQKAMQTKLASAPGEKYEYSNVGYTLLAMVVEQRSGQSFEQYLNEKLFKPAGMYTTGYVIPDFDQEKVAVGYRGEKVWGKLNEKNWGEEGPYWHLKGNGGILSNAKEMHKWHQALLTDKVLSEASKAKMYAKHAREGENARSHYGYGWAIFDTPRGTQLITHNGGNGIFMADMLRYPQDEVMIWFATNAVNASNRDTGWEIARMVFQPEYQAVVKGMEKPGPLTKQDEEVKAAFEKMIKAKDEYAIEAFVSARFSKEMIEMAPMDEHLAIMGQVKRELANAKLEKAVREGEAIVLQYVTKDGPLQLRMEIKAGKVIGLSIDG